MSLTGPSNVTQDSFQISWSQSQVADFKAYEIYFATVPSFAPTPERRYGTLAAVDETRATITGLQCGTTYHVRIRVLDQKGGMVDSRELAATTAACLTAGGGAATGTGSPGGTGGGTGSPGGTGTSGPGPHTTEPPTQPLEAVRLNPAGGITDRSMDLSWSPSALAAFQAYEVYLATSPGFTPSVATRFGSPIRQAGSTRLTLDNLQCGTTYYFRVRVLDRNGRWADSGEGQAQTASCPPQPIEAVRLTGAGGVTENSLELAWTRSAMGGFAAYEVHSSTAPGLVPSVGSRSGAPLNDVNQTRLTVGGLKCGTTYYFRVRTIDQNGKTADSNELSARTADCGVPDSLIVSSAGDAPYRTIKDALQACYGARDARPRTILIRPGTYALSERIMVLKPLKLIGMGSRGSVVLDAGAGPTVVVESRGSLLRNLTLQSSAATVLGVTGEATVEDCDIVSPLKSAVGISGSGSLTLRRCKISGSADKGILVWQQGSGRIEGCELSGNESGLEVRDQGRLTLSDCTITGNQRSGVYIHDGGRAELSGCTIRANGLDGVAVKAGSVNLRNCRINQNRQFGVSCGGVPGASISIADCDLTGNQVKAIEGGCTVSKSGSVKE